ncbi:hypothetical protein [Streptomyces sp. NPDC059814]
MAAESLPDSLRRRPDGYTVGVHRDRLKLSVPYGIAVDLTAIDEL